MIRKQQKSTLFVLLVMIASLLFFNLSTQTVQARALAEDVPVEPDGTGITIYMFWGDGCPHCEIEREFFRNVLNPQYPGLQVLEFETWNDAENQRYYQEMAQAFNVTAQYVPSTFIGDVNIIGFSPEIQEQIISQVETYIEQGFYPDPGARLEPETPVRETIVNNAEIKLPLIGVVDLTNSSLLVSTILIAVVDGFNPCSLWVLTMLIALTLHSGSRKRVFVIGAIFLSVSTLIYAIFITGLFSVMSFVSYLGWIQALVSVVALVFAIINIKDYFWYKEGVSLTIADDKKPGIFKRMRQVVSSSDSWWATILGTIVLAGGVSLVEFSCTAGLPVVWTNLLNAQGVSMATFLLLLLVYMVIYQIDELIIFIPAVLTLKSSKFEEKQGRLLKLLAGVVMLTISIVMLIDPAWMQALGNTVLMFVIALGATGLILFLHRMILPKYGILIGTELNQTKKKRKRDRR